MRSERGAALLIALGGLALIAALAAAALSVAIAPATRAASAVAQAQATRAAEGALHRLAAAMTDEELRIAAPLDGTVISTTFLDAEIDFAAQDVGGLVDLNAASEDMLARLAAATGVERSSEIAALWIAARQPLGRAGFATLEEALAQLPDDHVDDGALVLRHATVWSGRAAVDPWTATAPAFAAAAQVSLQAAQAFVARRALEGRRAPLPDGANIAGLAVSDATIARVTVRSRTKNGGRAAITAVLRANRSQAAPVTILSWR